MQAEQKNKANFGDIVMREIEVKLTLKEACKKYSTLTEKRLTQVDLMTKIKSLQQKVMGILK